MRTLKPRVLDVDPGVVKEIIREEYGLERSRYVRMISGRETGTRH